MSPGATLLRLYDRTVLKAPGWTLFALSGLLGLSAWGIRDFRLDASSDTLVLEHDEDLRAYRRISRRYGTREFVVVTYTPEEDLFSKRSLDRLKALRGELKGLKRVESVVTLLDVPLLKNPPVPLKDLRSNIKTLESKGASVSLAKEEFRTSPLYRNLVVGPDLKTTALQVFLRPDAGHEALSRRRQDLRDEKRDRALSPQEARELEGLEWSYLRSKARLQEERAADIAAIRRILERHREGARLLLGGVPMIAADIIAFVGDDLVVFGLGMLLLLVLVLGLVFRRARWVVLPMLCCAFSTLAMMGLLGWIGWEVTVVSSNFVSLQLILTMSLAIHLTVRCREVLRDRPGIPNREVLLEAVRTLFAPCLYATLTTMAGFASLMVCDILPVVTFGWMMSLGLAVSMIVTFTFFPAALCLASKPPPARETEFGKPLTSFFAGLNERRGGLVLLGAGAVAALTAFGASRLEVENSFIDYFKKKSEIYQGMRFIDEKLGGTAPLDVLIQFPRPPQPAGAARPAGQPSLWAHSRLAVPPQAGPDEDFSQFGEFEEEDDPAKYWFTTHKLERIDQVHGYLEGLEWAGKVLSLATLWRLGREINGGRPLDDLTLQVLFHRMPKDVKEAVVDPYASVAEDEARIVVRIKDSMKGLRRDVLLRSIRADLQGRLGLKEGEFRLSGLMVLYNNMLRSLFKSQIQTIWLTVAALMLMFLFLFRSWKVSLVAIVPNILSCMTVLGVMGLAGVSLDMMTITIVAISMGIAVDDTIHYLHRFKGEFAKDRDYLAAMRRCLGSIGNAMYYTSLAITIGFSILALSNFIPTVQFGLLTGLAMVSALVSNLSLLPVLVLVVKPFGSGVSGGKGAVKEPVSRPAAV